MNPYNIFRRLGAFNAIDGEIVAAGASTPVKVKAETRKPDAIDGAFAGLANVVAWSCDADVEITAGAVLVVANSVYPIVRGDNGLYWAWLYNRPGTRKLFFTRADNNDN